METIVEASNAQANFAPSIIEIPKPAPPPTIAEVDFQQPHPWNVPADHQ